MSEKTQMTNFDYEKFFRNARGWVFQAAQINPEEVISIGSMEWMYQAFKARMEAEAKADYEREMTSTCNDEIQRGGV